MLVFVFSFLSLSFAAEKKVRLLSLSLTELSLSLSLLATAATLVAARWSGNRRPSLGSSRKPSAVLSVYSYAFCGAPPRLGAGARVQ